MESLCNDYFSIFNGDPASAKMTKVFEIIEKLDFLPRAASSFFANLFKKESPKPDCDIVESNLRWVSITFITVFKFKLFNTKYFSSKAKQDYTLNL